MGPAPAPAGGPISYVGWRSGRKPPAGDCHQTGALAGASMVRGALAGVSLAPSA